MQVPAFTLRSEVYHRRLAKFFRVSLRCARDAASRVKGTLLQLCMSRLKPARVVIVMSWAYAAHEQACFVQISTMSFVRNKLRSSGLGRTAKLRNRLSEQPLSERTPREHASRAVVIASPGSGAPQTHAKLVWNVSRMPQILELAIPSALCFDRSSKLSAFVGFADSPGIRWLTENGKSSRSQTAPRAYLGTLPTLCQATTRNLRKQLY